MNENLIHSVRSWSSAFGVMLGTSLVSIGAERFRSPAAQSLWSAKKFARILDITKSDLNITYDPAFDPDRPSVFCQNHVNLLDAFTACAAIPQPFVGLMLAWHFKIPGYGWMMKATHGIPVHKGENRTQLLSNAACDRASKGMSILTFPEAHRTADGHMRPLKRGIFFMARDADLPVVAIAVRGMFEINRKGSGIINPGKVDVYVGPQVQTTGLDGDGISGLAQELGDAMSVYVDGEDKHGAALSAMAQR